jgi:PIN domain nuclease of toxin-antitoxin system
MAGSFGRDFHGDPADRLIVATAIDADVPLVTKDKNIRSLRKVAAIW